MVLSRDGVSGASIFDLMLDGKDVSKAPKDDFECVEKTRHTCLEPSNSTDDL